MAATKRNYREQGTQGGGIGGTKPSFSANFLTTESYSAEYIVLRGWRQNTFTTVTAYLYEVDEAFKPTGSALATSQSIPGGDIPLDPTASEITFTFGTPYTVADATEYAIVVTVTGGSQSHNWFDWFIDNTASGYKRGVYSSGAWAIVSNASHWFQVWGSDLTRQVILSSPTNEDIGIILQPLLEWTVDGTGQDDDDYFFPYLKKDDANFTEDDLLVNFYQGLWRQIISGLEYNTTYYWQVQAANEAGSLSDSDVWSFTITTFRPPAVSIGSGGASDFTGENNMLTKQRFIAAANNKIWYEDI